MPRTLKQVREGCNVKQDVLWKTIGRSERAVRGYEADAKSIPEELLPGIAAALDVSERWLRAELGLQPSPRDQMWLAELEASADRLRAAGLTVPESASFEGVLWRSVSAASMRSVDEVADLFLELIEDLAGDEIQLRAVEHFVQDFGRLLTNFRFDVADEAREGTPTPVPGPNGFRPRDDKQPESFVPRALVDGEAMHGRRTDLGRPNGERAQRRHDPRIRYANGRAGTQSEFAAIDFSPTSDLAEDRAALRRFALQFSELVLGTEDGVRRELERLDWNDPDDLGGIRAACQQLDRAVERLQFTDRHRFARIAARCTEDQFRYFREFFPNVRVVRESEPHADKTAALEEVQSWLDRFCGEIEERRRSGAPTYRVPTQEDKAMGTRNTTWNIEKATITQVEQNSGSVQGGALRNGGAGVRDVHVAVNALLMASVDDPHLGELKPALRELRDRCEEGRAVSEADDPNLMTRLRDGIDEATGMLNSAGAAAGTASALLAQLDALRRLLGF